MVQNFSHIKTLFCNTPAVITARAPAYRSTKEGKRIAYNPRLNLFYQVEEGYRRR